MKRASMTKTKLPVTGDDPRLGHGYEDRDAMNDRTKQEAGPVASATPKERTAALPPRAAWDEDTPPGKTKQQQRSREAEPYLTWLGQSLRQSYEETLNEPVPDSFGALLDRLELEDEDKPTR
jgi:hypothetical protein